MHQPKLQHPFINFLFQQQFNSKNNETKNKDQQADTVDAMHIFYKITLRAVRVRFPDVEIFRYLLPDTHNDLLKITRTKINSLVFLKTIVNYILFKNH